MKDKYIFAVTAIAEVEDDKEALEVGMPFSSIFLLTVAAFGQFPFLFLYLS